MGEIIEVPEEMAGIAAQILKDWKSKKETRVVEGHKAKTCEGCSHLHPDPSKGCGMASIFCVNTPSKPYYLAWKDRLDILRLGEKL